jgi:hypothetical protein
MTQKVTKQTTPKQTELTYRSAPGLFSDVEPSEFYEHPSVNWRLILWSVLGTLVVMMGAGYSRAYFFASPTPQITQEEEAPSFVAIPSPTPLPTPAIAPSPAPSPKAFTFSEPTPVPTPVPDGRTLILTSAPGDTGWVVSEDESIVTIYDPQNHFGDSFLYVGALDGRIYQSAFQFDLRQVPRGTKIYAASLRLTGLRADQMAEQGEWRLQMLSSASDPRWREHNYNQIHEASVLSTFKPILTPEQLGEGQINVFEFTPEQI